MPKAELRYLKWSFEQELWHISPRSWLTTELILAIVINMTQKSPRNASSQFPNTLVLQLDGTADHTEKKKIYIYIYLTNTSCQLHWGDSQWLRSQKTAQQNQVTPKITWPCENILSLPRQSCSGCPRTRRTAESGLMVFTYFCPVYWIYKQHFVLQHTGQGKECGQCHHRTLPDTDSQGAGNS